LAINNGHGRKFAEITGKNPLDISRQPLFILGKILTLGLQYGDFGVFPARSGV
jgi:hypothetical protein